MNIEVAHDWSLSFSLEVLETYWYLRGTDMIARALLYDDFIALAIFGRQGTGKTTYAYNIIKAGYIKALCAWHFQKYDVPFDACVKYILQNYGPLCMHGYCIEPDAIDRKLAPAVYVGLSDLNRLLLDIQDMASNRKRIRVMFLDDVINKKLFYTEWRKSYLDFLRAWQLIRTVARIVVFTAINKHTMPNEILGSVAKIHAWRDLELRVITYTMWRSQLSPRPAPMESKNGIKLDTAYRVLFTKVMEDVVPLDLISKKYAMPRWLEEKIDERKRAILSSLLRKEINRAENDGESEE